MPLTLFNFISKINNWIDFNGNLGNLNFIFTLLCGASKGFMKAFKASIKPFEAVQRSVKIKI